jgi:sugar O-acyltransferase (sialic acid O-acetyltransferase NeuD family)
MKKLAIIGYSAMTREILPRLEIEIEYDIFVNDEYAPILEKQPSRPNSFYLLSQFNPTTHMALVTVGDPITRRKIVSMMPPETEYYTFIDKDVKIFDSNIKIGCGSIICANTILTTNIIIGSHSHINLNNTICHDVIIGDFFTTAPGVNISGTCTIGNNVYIGTNSAVKQKISICDNVVVGMCSGVNKHITKSGTYVGTPIRFLNDNMKCF